MKLYLVQHGNALSKDENPDRPLSETGRADVKRIADFINPLNIEVTHLAHSTKLRAKQTAEILSEAVKAKKGLSERADLSPNNDIVSLEKELADESGDLMVVGHMPYLGKLASQLLSGSEQANTVKFRQGCTVCLNYDTDTGWQVEWMLTPQLIAGQ